MGVRLAGHPPGGHREPGRERHVADDLPVLDQDIVGAMSRFLDSSAIGTGGTTILVDGVEVNALTLSASAVQQIKINQDPYAAEFMRPG